MHSSEEDLLEICNDCGTEIVVAMERGFACGPETYLCFECAIARGGVFDESSGEWVVRPRWGRTVDAERAVAAAS